MDTLAFVVLLGMDALCVAPRPGCLGLLGAYLVSRVNNLNNWFYRDYSSEPTIVPEMNYVAHCTLTAVF